MTPKQRLLLLIILFLFIILDPLAAFVLLEIARGESEPVGPGHRYTESIPILELDGPGIALPTDPAPIEQGGGPTTAFGGGSDPANPYAVINQTGPQFLQPGATAGYEITLANYESLTHTYRLTDTLPAELTYISGSSDLLRYDPTSRTLTWQGELAGAGLDYIIEESDVSLPYIDLADFGAPNLCDDFIANGGGCDDVAVTFNLGINGYTANLYGQLLSQLTVSSNGLILGNQIVAGGQNHWLPDTAAPEGPLLAGLWRDVDMGGAGTAAAGRWHVAILSGLVADYDVFYAQWHDAPQANDPDLTARHAIAVLLNHASAASTSSATSSATGRSLSGVEGSTGSVTDIFYLYDNIADPAGTVATGYTIGIQDKVGLRGGTYAYAPCCGNPQPPQGYPPAAGTTLHLRPVLLGAGNDYQRTFHYQAVVGGQVPQVIANTAEAASSSADPSLAYVWSTHYLSLRFLNYLPFEVAW